MREILFRGKPSGNAWITDWVYGAFCPKNSKGDIPCIIVYDDRFAGHWFEVIPETVGQYTGLTDKNGTKIFEGDIISIPFEEDRSPWEENCIYYENGEVYFSAEHRGWYVRFLDNETLSLWEYDELDIEIIGNIHDNPELLKGELG